MSKTDLAPWQQLQVDLADYARGRRDSLPVEPPQRRQIAVYRRLVQGNISSVLAKVFPLTAARVGADRWQTWVVTFMAHGELHSPYFNAISGQFLAFVLTETEVNRWQLQAFSQVELELLHYEWLELFVAQQPAVIPCSATSASMLTAQSQLIVASGVSLAQYQYPVHEVNSDWQGEPSATYLALYRAYQETDSSASESADKVSFLRLQPLTFFMLSQLTTGMTWAALVEVLGNYLESHQAPANWQLLLEQTLAEFIRLGVVKVVVV